MCFKLSRDVPPRATTITTEADSIRDLVVVDVDGDGDEDLITVLGFDETIGLCENLTIDEKAVGTSYCSPGVPNSTGQPATLALVGSDLAAENRLRLVATGLPAQQFGFFIAGRTQGVFPGAGGSQGTLCLGGSIARVLSSVQSSGPDGRLEYALDLTAIPLLPSTAVQPGEVWNFQAWHRDLNPSATSNFSGGATITFR